MHPLIGYLYEFRMTYEGFFIETKERLCYPRIVWSYNFIL